MRERRAPLKGIASGYKPADTTVVVLTCIPAEAGYYADRFTILKACLGSIIAHTDTSYDLMVVDNGSVPEVTGYLVELERTGDIGHLMLNRRNLGLSGALNIAFGAAPGKYIAFSNDDVFFHPDWLSEHIRVLEAFPRAGLVSGQLAPGPDRQDDAINAAAEDGTRISRFTIPDAWVESFAHSVGLTLEQYLGRPWARENRDTYLLERNGCKAYAGKTGYSHLFRKEILHSLDCFPFETGLLAGDGTDRQLAHAIKESGHLWLTTFEKTTEHLGNRLDSRWHEKLKAYGISDILPSSGASPLRVSDNRAPQGSRLRRAFRQRVIKNRLVQKGINRALEKLIELRY